MYQQTLFETQAINRGAAFSKCRSYRYALWHVWNEQLPLIMFIGLNPSTANETKPDPTITRVTNYSKNWGYGGFYMMNLFALVSRHPSLIKTHTNPLGDNDKWLEEISPRCQDVIFAWGAFKEARERAKKVIGMFPQAKALVINNDGSPRHPLYVKGAVVPVNFNLKAV